MKILITGGAGFIGSHLAEAHLEHGDDVYIIDDLSTGSIDNIRHLQENPQYEKSLFVHINTILHHDIMLELIGICDLVYHMAAAVGVRLILEQPLKAIQTNIQGTEKILELCKSHNLSPRMGVVLTLSVDKDESSPDVGFGARTVRFLADIGAFINVEYKLSERI